MGNLNPIGNRKKLSQLKVEIFWGGIIGAGDGARTRYPQLGRLMLYQMSYSRINLKSQVVQSPYHN